MSLIQDVLNEDLPAAEKLVLAVLAAYASEDGYGVHGRDRLKDALDYKPRSVQRLLKSLRDSGHLEDLGDGWYSIDVMRSVSGAVNYPPRGPKVHIKSEDPRKDLVAGPSDTITIDGDQIGRAVANHVVDAGEQILDQLNNFELRMGELAARMAAFHVEPGTPAEPPPPDPVLEAPEYAQLVDMGFTPEAAYDATQELLAGRAVAVAAADEAASVTAEPPNNRYDDTPGGRLARVADILAGDTALVPAALEKRWAALERAENKHTVRGEVDAFELLYPAIVDAAKRNVGMPLEQFLDPKVVPWEQDPGAAAKSDAVLAPEVERMVAEIHGANDPRFTINPRTTEEAADGTTLVEPMSTYHRRVKAVYDQMTAQLEFDDQNPHE